MAFGHASLTVSGEIMTKMVQSYLHDVMYSKDTPQVVYVTKTKHGFRIDLQDREDVKPVKAAIAAVQAAS